MSAVQAAEIGGNLYAHIEGVVQGSAWGPAADGIGWFVRIGESDGRRVASKDAARNELARIGRAPLKALVARQPWAELIARGVKRVENRGSLIHRRGPLAIVAGSGRYSLDELGHIYDLPEVRAELGDLSTAHDRLPRGFVVAVVSVTGSHQVEGADWCCRPWGWFSYGASGAPACHTVWDRVVRLPEPVPAKGRQSVTFDLDPEVAAAVEAQIAGVW